MKVLHIAVSLSQERGGPTQIVTELTEALAKKGVEVSIFAPSENDKGIDIGGLKGVDVQLFPKTFLSKFWASYSSPLAEALMQEVYNFDLLHIHEIWHHPHYVAYRAARLARKPFVVTIHGLLEPWCLAHKAFKKKIFSFLLQKKILKEASGIHAITEEEVKNISDFVDNKNIFLLPNGLNTEEFNELPNGDAFDDLYPEVKGKKTILFLGRIHPVKGLDILAKAFGGVAGDRKDVRLIIAGPDSEGYQVRVEQMLETSGVRDKVIFTGMLTGRQKLVALSRADIFVLPSYSEGLSMSILEAMACEIPLIITKGCNFPEVAKMGAGKVIDANANTLAEALIELLDNPSLCKKMYRRGKRLVMERYSLDKMVDKMITVYEKILNDQNVDRRSE